MSKQCGVLDLGFKASTTLSAKQYYIVKLSGSGTPEGVTLSSAVTDVSIGVLQNEPLEQGAEAVVRVLGTTKVICGTPIAIGQFIVPDASGKAYYSQADKDFCIGIALETGSAANDLIEIMLTHFKASI